jgi:predicted DNA-binding transcriptional regulator AlpA
VEITSNAQLAKRRYRPLGSISSITAGDFRIKPERLFSTDDIAAAGIIRSRTALHRAVKSGRLPRPMRLPGNRLAWRGRVLADWLDALEATAPS